MSLGMVVVMVVMGLLAYQRGFNPFAWILAAGCLGALVLFFLPSAKEVGLDAEAKRVRTQRGNLVGGCLTALTLLAGLVGFVVGLTEAISA
ncbi:hypothetical protein ACFWU5_02680 [Nocardia sp. NPDC058640]|uniref:hypothetical protein n=1 Tax=Nocardia sp. NPDC058640 TaxID=3346571 RepID=UPI00365B453B